jgi:hypothetical protein
LQHFKTAGIFAQNNYWKLQFQDVVGKDTCIWMLGWSVPQNVIGLCSLINPMFAQSPG